MPQVFPVPAVPEASAPKEEMDAIGAGTLLRGTIAFVGTLVINGGFVGRVHAPEGTVRIGPEGQVEADMEVAELQVEGKARGSLFAHDSIELRNGADVQGSMRCARVRIAREAAFNGFCECYRPPSPEPEKRMERPDLYGFFTAVRIASVRP
ncbi:MAG: polymer-forming cytoskeletal protein [Methylacidiphilaceae bacterium]|nr:polymer-forming cytoskeletal protein [Candidatus Methylacidiphilaceae bacterium]